MIRKLFAKKLGVSAGGLLIAVAALAQVPLQWRGSSRLWEPQSAYCRLYDTRRVVTVQGTVLRVEKGAPMRGMGYGIHLILKTPTETLPVHLGPSWYVEKQPNRITARDVIEVTGSRVSCDGKMVLLGAVVNKAGETIKFREANGFPCWAGWRH